MYTPRFRHRNTVVAPGDVAFDSYSRWSGDCNNPVLYWKPYYSGSQTGNFGTVDTMDDIAGDPPDRKKGLSGYRFHPMTKVMVSFEGGEGDGQWTTREKALSCNGYPGSYYNRWRRRGAPGASKPWSGLSIPIRDGRLDLEQVPYPSSQIAQLQALAETAVLANRGQYGETNLYESLAEIDKTLGMVKDILGRAHRIQNGLFFKRGGVAKLRTLTDEAAGQLLLTRYGFKPLISDVVALLTGLGRPLGRRLLSTRQAQHWSDQQTVALSDYVDAGTVVYTRTMTTAHSVEVRSQSLDNVEITLLGSMGLGARDFVSVPWELMTGSFVVDWWANVGDVIASILPTFGLSNVGMSTTVNWTCSQTVRYSVKGLVSSLVSTQSLESASAPESITRNIVYKNRTVGEFSPQLSWTSDFKLDNAMRCADILALLAVQAKRITPVLRMSPDDRLSRRLTRLSYSRKGVNRAEDYLN